MNSFEKFDQLHRQQSPLLLGNIWDVNSAQFFEAAGYDAIGTSSQAVAVANGYHDGEQLPFEQLLRLAKKVTEVTNIPFTVDIEGGYDRSLAGITDNIQKLYDVGVVGINLEDTIIDGKRKLQSIATFTDLLAGVADYIGRNNLKLFLNVRTDGFLLGLPNALEETLKRAKFYEGAGASGLFTPCVTAKDDIRAIVEATKLPVNVMCMPYLPNFEELTALGVKRISMGGFFFNKVYQDADQLAKTILNGQDFGPIFS